MKPKPAPRKTTRTLDRMAYNEKFIRLLSLEDY